MKITNDKIIISRFIKVPCDKCEEMIRSYFISLKSDSSGGLSISYKNKYTFRDEDGYTDKPVCKECFQISNIKK